MLLPSVPPSPPPLAPSTMSTGQGSLSSGVKVKVHFDLETGAISGHRHRILLGSTMCECFPGRALRSRFLRAGQREPEGGRVFRSPTERRRKTGAA